MERQKSYWIDALKAFGIVLVVIGHSGVPGMIGKFIYGFHMPLFFMISGYLFNEEKWFSNGFLSFTKNRWVSYIKLYFIWATINLVLNFPIELLDNGFSFQQTIDSTLKHVWWILISYGGSRDFPNCTPLWYLPCLFIASLYLYGLVLLEKKRGLMVALLASSLMLVTNYFLGLCDNLILPWHIDVALGASVFMYLGYKIKKESWLSKSRTPVIVISFLLIGIVSIMANEKIDMNMNQFGCYPFFYMGAFFISFLMMSLFRNGRKHIPESDIISVLGGGRNTITILALNYFLNTIYIRSIGRFMPGTIGWMVDVVFVITTSYLIICAINKFRIHQT